MTSVLYILSICYFVISPSLQPEVAQIPRFGRLSQGAQVSGAARDARASAELYTNLLNPR